MNFARVLALVLAMASTTGIASAGIYNFTGTVTLNVPATFTPALFFWCSVYTGVGGTLLGSSSEQLTVSGGKFSGPVSTTVNTTLTDGTQKPGYWACQIGTNAKGGVSDAFTFFLENGFKFDVSALTNRFGNL
jgi:hypothetical protein